MGKKGTKRSNGEAQWGKLVKKRKTEQADGEVSEAHDFDAVNLLDSDEEAENDEPDVTEEPVNEDDDPGDTPSDSEEDDSSYPDSDEANNPSTGPNAAKQKSKRNDPSAFSTSITRILSTKLSTTRRADPIFARNTQAQEASRVALDSALEGRARRHLKEQKKAALDKGRVRDVIATAEAGGGEGASVAEGIEDERRLRKVAQRGVVCFSSFFYLWPEF
jgi:hypothetical protein